jgi:hypothetical protein
MSARMYIYVYFCCVTEVNKKPSRCKQDFILGLEVHLKLEDRMI